MEYLLALIFPFFILLLEKILVYPYIIEELFKFILAKKADSTKTAIVLGLMFSYSEAIFYVFNPTYQLSPQLFLSRFLLVTPMHITTILIMQYFSKRKNLWVLGLSFAILIHYIFNSVSV